MASTQKQTLLSQTALAAASTNGDSYNPPAKSKNFIGHLSTANTNGATTVTAKIQHSPDKTNWYDYATFTALVGVNGAEAKLPTNQPMFPYVRAQVALAGVTKLADVIVDLWFENLG